MLVTISARTLARAYPRLDSARPAARDEDLVRHDRLRAPGRLSPGDIAFAPARPPGRDHRAGLCPDAGPPGAPRAGRGANRTPRRCVSGPKGHGAHQSDEE